MSTMPHGTMPDPRRPVVIIGAGLAGLCAARKLIEANPANPPIVLEAADAPGGRVRSDVVEGFILDRGFQVFLDAYPEAQAVLEYQPLGLRPFYPGALVMLAGKPNRIADPFRKPLDAARGFLSPVATMADKARLAELDLKIRARSLASVWELPEETTLNMLQRSGFAGTTIDRFFRPFFGGVFFDRSLQTSARMFRFVYRMFATGSTTVPEMGMQAIPDQLAATLPAGTLRLNTRVQRIERLNHADQPQQPRYSVHTDTGESLHASHIIIATDQTTAHRLAQPLGIELPFERPGDRPDADPRWQSTATIWFDAPASPTEGEPILVLDGDGKGPVNHLMTMSDAAPTYAPPGRHLVCASIVDPEALTLDDTALLAASMSQLTAWFGDPVNAWRVLRIDHISQALPNQFAFRLDPPQRPVRLRTGSGVCPGLYAAGDWLDNASINGAMESGRRCAAVVLAEMGRPGSGTDDAPRHPSEHPA